MATHKNYKRIFEPDTRIDLIQREYYYEFNEGFNYWNKVILLMKQPPTKTKIMGLLLTGEPSSGKSTLNQQFSFEYLQNVKDAKENDIVIFNVPQGVGAVQVFAQLCRELKIPDIPPNPRNYPITYFVLKAAAKLREGHRLLIVDEFQNLYEVQGVQRKKIMSSFNQLINASRIPIVLVGTPEVHEILYDKFDQDISNLKGTFSSRFPEFALKRWKDNDEFRGILVSVYEDLHLCPSNDSPPFYTKKKIREKILVYTEGLLGKIITLLKETAMKIISEQLPEEITLELLGQIAVELEYIEPDELNS
ncbi:MAG: TniB family NTP-binding protein [Promethearchaeota archaeon]